MTKPEPSEKHSETIPKLHHIQAILEKTRRAMRRPLFLEGALWYLGTIATVILSALLFSLLLGDDIGAKVTPWIALAGVTLTSLIFGGLALKHILQGPDLLAVARAVQRHANFTRDDLVSALKLGQQLQDGSFDASASSRPMAMAHINKTGQRAFDLAKANHGHLASFLPPRDYKPGLIAAGSTLLLCGIAFAIAPIWCTTQLTGAVQNVIENIDRQEERMLLGNLHLSIRAPQYTRLSPRMESFSTGNTQVIAGSQVTISGYLLIGDDEIVSVQMLQNIGAKTQTREVDLEQDRVEISLPINQTTTYRFQAITKEGRVIQDQVERTLKVQKDTPPTLEITSHQGELEVGADDVLELEYQAADDFGLESLARVHMFSITPDEKTRRVLNPNGLKERPTAFQGSYSLDLKELGIQPRDRVVFYLEATDNNNVTGPGVTLSAPIILKISSPEDKHFQNIEAQRALMNQLVDSLANYLETPLGSREVANKKWSQRVDTSMAWKAFEPKLEGLKKANVFHRALLKEMQTLSASLQEDPLMVPRDVKMFTSLTRQLQTLDNQGERLLSKVNASKEVGNTAQELANWAQKTETTLEKGILRLEDLLTSQQMQAAKDTADEIRELRERLKELLTKYKESKDPELKKAIKREIQRLRQRMQELMRRMQSQIKEMPREHMNREAIEKAQMESEAKKIADEFSTIEDLLDKDDIDGALKALEEMGKQLDELTSEMDQEFDKAQPQGLSEFDKDVSELMDQVNDLSQLQQSVEKETQETQEALREAQSQQMKSQLEQFKSQMSKSIKQQQKELNALKKQPLPGHLQPAMKRAQQQLDSLRDSLKHNDIDSGQRAAQSLERELENMRLGLDVSKRYLSKGSKRRAKIENAAKSTKPMIERAEQMSQDFDAMMRQARRNQQSNQGKLDQLAQKQGQVEQQAKRLSNKLGQAAKKHPSLDGQLQQSMKRAQKSMKDASKGLQRGRPQRALDSERQALQELKKLNQQMQQSVQKERNQKRRDGQGSKRNKEERVKIPGKADPNKSEAYRKALKETMKEERLDDYSDQIKDYYKNLFE